MSYRPRRKSAAAPRPSSACPSGIPAARRRAGASRAGASAAKPRTTDEYMPTAVSERRTKSRLIRLGQYSCAPVAIRTTAVSPRALVLAAAVPILFLHVQYQPGFGVGIGSTTIDAYLSDFAVL